MPPLPKSHATRERLLQAAGSVFAEHGFEHGTVRDIAHRSGANIASVNYYFGDKRRLYAEALRYGLSQALTAFPPDQGVQPDAPAAERLFAFIHSFLRRFLDTGQPEWYSRLCARELAEPTPALDDLVEHIVRPLAQRLQTIVRELAGDTANDTLIRECALSIVGQCLLYQHNRPVIERLYGREAYTPERIEALARHITAFSLGAIAALRTRTII